MELLIETQTLRRIAARQLHLCLLEYWVRLLWSAIVSSVNYNEPKKGNDQDGPQSEMPLPHKSLDCSHVPMRNGTAQRQGKYKTLQCFSESAHLLRQEHDQSVKKYIFHTGMQSWTSWNGFSLRWLLVLGIFPLSNQQDLFRDKKRERKEEIGVVPLKQVGKSMRVNDATSRS